MTYDMAVWEGDRPASHAAALDVFERVMDAMDADWEAGRPSTPAVRRFLDALRERYPDDPADQAEDSPWALAPIADCGAGGAAYLNLVVGDGLDEWCAFIARTAGAHGLVCFDPQTEELQT